MQPMPAPPMLRAAGLTMTYPGGSTALAGLTVDVPAGSVGLVGSSLVVSSQRAGELAQALPVVAREAGIRLLEVRPLDDSLESVFRELLR